MGEGIFFDLDGERFSVSRDKSGNGFNKTSYQLDITQGVWKAGEVISYRDFDTLLLAIFAEQFKRTDRSPQAVFDAAKLVMCQMTEEVSRVRGL